MNMNFLKDLWASFLSLPIWVRIWTFLILVPINFAAVLFLGNPNSILITFLAVIGIAVNVIPMIFYRGFTYAMAISHVIFWIPLVAILIFQLFIFNTPLTSEYRYFLLLLLACNIFSLIFDIPDTIRWFRDRKIIP